MSTEKRAVAWECAVCGADLVDLSAADMHSAEHTDHYAIPAQ